MVTCEVCGTANEPKLTFCRNCGHRLRATGAREVPPTPATGLPAAGLARARQRSEDELSWDPNESSGAHRSRPSAPPIFFGKSQGDGEEAAAAPLREPDVIAPKPEPVPADKVSCAHCGALSPKSYRFCISCGAVLKKPAKSPQPAAVALPAPSPFDGSGPKGPAPFDGSGPKGPAPFDGSGPKGPEPPPSRKPPPPRPKSQRTPALAELEEIAPLEVECPRCGGACQLGETFCKHCGASLGKGGGAVDEARRRHVSETPDAPVELMHKMSDGEPFPLADSAAKVRAPGAPAVAVATSIGAPSANKPLPEVTGKLVVIVEDGSEGRALELRGRQVDIGSQDGDIVLSEDRYLSPRHARFFRQEGHWYLRDLDSVNGVYRRLRKATPLRDRDLVLLGLEVLQFDLVDHAERGLGHAIEHGVLVFGSPATTRRARLCQRTVEGVTRDVYHLVSDETTIGRETGDIVFTSDPFMSRRHAMITWDDEAQQYVLTDLNSSNGTYLAIVDDVRLEDGDYIRLGQHLFRVDLPRTKAR